MGGQHSVVTQSDTANIISDSLTSANSSCISYVNADNVIEVTGNGDVLSNIDQTLTIQLSSDCVNSASSNTSFQNNVANSVAQQLSSEQQELVGWLDESSNDASSNVSTNITNQITQETTETCMNDLDSKNVLEVSGDADVVNKVIQSSTNAYMVSCLLDTDDSAGAINNATDAVNQGSTYASQSMLAPLVTALEALLATGFGVLLLLLIAVVCFVGIYKLFKSHRGGGGPGLPAAAASAARSPNLLA